MPNANQQQESPEEVRITKGQVLRLLQQVHPDKINDIIPEHKEDTALCSELLFDVTKRIKGAEGRPVTWSPDIRERFPIDSEVTLVGVRDGKLIPPVTVPLRRPDVFVRMYESFLKTGTVPKELIDDDAEPEYLSEEEADQTFFGGDINEEMQEHLDDIETAKTIEQLYGIKIATKADSQMALLEAGVLHALDEKAQKILFEEITDGSKERLELAITHLQKYGPEFSDPSIAEDLQALLDTRVASTDPETIVYASPTNSTRWERQAAEIKSIDELASLAISVRTDRSMTNEEDRRRARHAIDTMAKNIFLNEIGKADSVQKFVELAEQANEFPFAGYAHDSIANGSDISLRNKGVEPDYKNDVLDIIETRAKYFILGVADSGAFPQTTEGLDTLEDAVRKFPFKHPENLAEINNEIIIQREKVRGNQVSYQRLETPDAERQDSEIGSERSGWRRILGRAPDTTRSDEPRLGRRESPRENP